MVRNTDKLLNIYTDSSVLFRYRFLCLTTLITHTYVWFLDILKMICTDDRAHELTDMSTLLETNRYRFRSNQSVCNFIYRKHLRKQKVDHFALFKAKIWFTEWLVEVIYDYYYTILIEPTGAHSGMEEQVAQSWKNNKKLRTKNVKNMRFWKTSTKKRTTKLSNRRTRTTKTK